MRKSARIATLAAIAITASLSVTRVLVAQEHAAIVESTPSESSTGEVSSGESTAMPHLPSEAAWVPPMLIVIAGMFVAARVIGPAVRAEMIEQAADAHGRDAHVDHSHSHDAHGH